MNFRPCVAGRSLVYKLNRIDARTEPWGRPLRWGLQEWCHCPCAPWCSGNTLDLINVVTLRCAWLLPRWVTVFGRVNHLGAEPGTQVYSARACHLWLAGMSTQRKLGSKQAHCMIHQPVSMASQCGAGAWLYGLASGDQRRLAGSGSVSEACSWRWAIHIHCYFTVLSLPPGTVTENWKKNEFKKTNKSGTVWLSVMQTRASWTSPNFDNQVYIHYLQTTTLAVIFKNHILAYKPRIFRKILTIKLWGLICCFA